MDNEKGSKDAAARAQDDGKKAAGNSLEDDSDTAVYIDRLAQYLTKRLATPSGQQTTPPYVLAKYNPAVLNTYLREPLPESSTAAAQRPPPRSGFRTPQKLREDPVLKARILKDLEQFAAFDSFPKNNRKSAAMEMLEHPEDPYDNKDFRRNMECLAGDLPPMAINNDLAFKEFRSVNLKKDLAGLHPLAPEASAIKQLNMQQRVGERSFLAEIAASSSYASHYGDSSPTSAYQEEYHAMMNAPRGMGNEYRLLPEKTMSQAEKEYEAKLKEGREDYDDAFMRNLQTMLDDDDNGKKKQKPAKTSQSTNATQAKSPAGRYYPVVDKEALSGSEDDSDDSDKDSGDEDVVMSG